MSCAHLVDGRCERGFFGGRPSAGICARCDEYEGPLRGLGDVIDAGLRLTGIKAIVVTIAPDCRCADRRAALNEARPIGGH